MTSKPLLAVLACGFLSLTAQQPAPVTVYTDAQAAAGRAAYQSSCAACHTDTLIPPAGSQYVGQEIPPLAGSVFMNQWGERTTAELSRRIKTAIGGFPPTNLTEKTYLELAAYILQANGARAGKQELTSTTAVVIHDAAAGNR